MKFRGRVQPPLATKRPARVCEDSDAPGETFTHWFIFNLPAEPRLPAAGAARDAALAVGWCKDNQRLSPASLERPRGRSGHHINTRGEQTIPVGLICVFAARGSCASEPGPMIFAAFSDAHDVELVSIKYILILRNDEDDMKTVGNCWLFAVSN